MLTINILTNQRLLTTIFKSKNKNNSDKIKFKFIIFSKQKIER